MSLVEKAGEASDFAEQMRATEAAEGIPSDSDLYAQFLPDEGADKEPPHAQPAKEAPVEAEVDPTATPPEEVEATPEEALPELPEEPDKLAELNKKVGQLVNENADFKRQIEAYQQQFQQQYQQPQYQPQLTQESVNYIDELAMENPQQAVAAAIQSNQPVLYDRALRAWYDQDPVSASRYERQVEYQQLQQQFAAQVQPQLQSAQQMADSQQLEQAMANVAGKHEDFAEVIGTLDENRAQEIINSGLPPAILNDLAGDLPAKERVIESIYRWVKADLKDTIGAAAAEAATKQAEENKQAKVDATVASATTTTPDSVPETEEERLLRVWKESRPSMQSAWTGRSAR